ncbi:hypothetical protein HanPI659440_Chr07g0258961 [Helianthus annuus]|nr:hypothetical protein HanPI659440_Chr07g0258961 [Helianthus annuus]
MIIGVIENARLKNLKGISVKILVVWLNIVEVSRNGDELDFLVRIMSVGSGIDNFVESLQCGCGFDCDKLFLGDFLCLRCDLNLVI